MKLIGKLARNPQPIVLEDHVEKPKIFVASSSEAIVQAKLIADILSHSHAEVMLWQDYFEPGDLLFQAMEHGAPWFAGAVFLATPDDLSVIREETIRIPRTNVMLELGLFTAIIGRKKIALCKYDNAVLPSDLSGFTYIQMGGYPAKDQEDKIDGKALMKLQSWLGRLESLVEKIPCNQIVHGYSGKWSVYLDYDIWGGTTIAPPDAVVLEGEMVVHVPRDGTTGYGSLWVEASIQVDDCHLEFKMMFGITSIGPKPDGSLSIEIRHGARQRTRISGDISANEKLKGNPLVEQEPPGPHILRSELRPCPGEPRKLAGELTMRTSKKLIRSHASIEAFKID